jgi:hypothetical protein
MGGGLPARLAPPIPTGRAKPRAISGALKPCNPVRRAKSQQPGAGAGHKSFFCSFFKKRTKESIFLKKNKQKDFCVLALCMAL